MKFIIGTKLEMSQVWQGDKVIAVTRVKTSPCTVAQTKQKEKDGYTAVQLGYGERKEKNINKPQLGHTKGLGNFKGMREFRVDSVDVKRGDKIDVNTFEVGDIVKVSGVTKGKGFQGVVKRHGFKGSKKTHGNKDQLRMPGSIGATGPAHVFKGMKMGGRMGGQGKTIANLEIIEIDKENNILSVKGAIPGARNGLILIVGEGELKVIESKKEEAKTEVKPEEKKAEVKPETPEQVEKEVVEAKEKVDDKIKK